MLKGVFTRRFGSICASALGSFCISLWIYELWPSILVCKVHLCNCYREEKHRKKRSFFVANAGSTNDATSFALSACILCVGIFVRKGGVFQGDPPTKKNGANRNVSILFLEMKSVSIFHFVSKNKIETSLFFCTPPLDSRYTIRYLDVGEIVVLVLAPSLAPGSLGLMCLVGSNLW